MLVNLITRVNLKYDPKFVFTQERMTILENLVAPRVREQSFKDFEWIGFIDEDTSLEMLERLVKIFDIVIFDQKKYNEDIRWKEMLTIRLDTDDLPEPDYIKEIVNNVDTTKDIQLIIANRGTDCNMETLETIDIQVDYPIWFFGMYEKSYEKWCYYWVWHSKRDFNNTYLSEKTDKLLWKRLIHSDNRGSKVLLSKYKI